MIHPELETLNRLSLRAHLAIHDGEPEGLAGLCELERQLVSALDDAAPAHHASAEFRQGMGMLEGLRKAIEVEQLLAGVPLYDLKLVT